MNKIIQSTWSCDAAAGDLYENDRPAGKLITGNSPNPGAWLRLIQQANAAPELFAALKPFADLLEYPDDWPEEMFPATVSLKDIKQARAALEKAGGSQ